MTKYYWYDDYEIRLRVIDVLITSCLDTSNDLENSNYPHKTINKNEKTFRLSRPVELT